MRVLDLLTRFGTASTAFQILEQGFSYWFDDQAPGVIAFVEAGGHWVAAGPPAGPPDQIPHLVRRFVAAGHALKLKVVFFGVESTFIEQLSLAEVPHDALVIGEQADFIPADYCTEGPERRSLRAQINRVRRKGVRVHRIEPDELADAPSQLRAQIERVLNTWLHSRRMSVMRFMVDLEPFTFPEHRRYYIAEQGDQAVGFLAAIPVPARDGWFLEDVIRVPNAPNGTADILIHTALEDTRTQGDAYATLGLSPLAGVQDGPGPHRRLRRVLVLCYRWLGPLYRFEGVRSFKARFRPTQWSPVSMVSCSGPVRVRTFHAVLSAFAGGGLFQFGFDTSLRLLARVPLKIWAGGLRALSILLVPWTLLLALADGRHWFGDASIQWAWVVFDSVFVCALYGLAKWVDRGRAIAAPIALFLGGATLTDFVLSSVQAFYLHRAVTGWALLFVLAGQTGPLLATLFLVALGIAAPVRRR